MPVDRIVTVSVVSPGMRDQHGEFVPGATAKHRVWATRFDQDLEDLNDEGGARTTGRRDWRVRWRRDIADITDLSTIEVQDGAQTWDVTNLVEDMGRFGDVRRRWLRIQGVVST